MSLFKIEKGVLNSLLTVLQKEFEIIAPVKNSAVRFQSIKDPEEIYLDAISYFPAKEYFFRKKEVLFGFKGLKIAVPELEKPKRIFFGLRKCDLNAIKHQDKVFLETVKDPYYSAMRENSILIGYHCNTAPSKYCFCGTLNLQDYYDLLFFDRGEIFYVDVGTEKGQRLIDSQKKFFEPIDYQLTVEDRKISNAGRLLTDDISEFYDNHLWTDGINNCLSCGACTALCPTCYCFEMHDEVSTKNIKNGERIRNWSSCQLREFTKVAGNHVFRNSRDARFKHRIYHQLQYFREKNGVNLCVGCGRCIAGCPTRIDFVEIINEMKNGQEKKQ